ncbi:hypothetical protein D9611_014306 [Ephemerocybe angulata]|uniref:Uncharacterized protein n=1 Tax=Ephemerocybe angulata TaxID=980116 RepID=A0A8H5BTJ1_9AGAR|nr:hypothetical protein D9611_014306 [Tulosesus angulatus]
MASGLKYFSSKYGFGWGSAGVLDGWAYIRSGCKNVTEAREASIRLGSGRRRSVRLWTHGSMNNHGKHQEGEFIDEGWVSSETHITKEMLAENNFERLEHVTVRVWIDHTRRGVSRCINYYY